LTAEQAVEYGIIDQIMSRRELGKKGSGSK
jgi:ATP-dependent protease ClpP protease subunit